MSSSMKKTGLILLSDIALEKQKDKPISLKLGLGMVVQFLLGFAVLAFFAGIGYQGYAMFNNFRTESSVGEAVSLTKKAVQAYTATGNSCTGFTLANAQNYFDTSYTYSSGTVTLPGGDITMTATCSNPPGSTTINRVGLAIAGLEDEICTSTVTSFVNDVEALRVGSGSSNVIVKNYRERNPSGRANIGNTACAPGSVSTITMWLN